MPVNASEYTVVWVGQQCMPGERQLADAGNFVLLLLYWPLSHFFGSMDV